MLVAELKFRTAPADVPCSLVAARCVRTVPSQPVSIAEVLLVPFVTQASQPFVAVGHGDESSLRLLQVSRPFCSDVILHRDVLVLPAEALFWQCPCCHTAEIAALGKKLRIPALRLETAVLL